MRTTFIKKRVLCLIIKSQFYLQEILKSLFSFKPKLKILFPEKGFDFNTKLGFYFSRHEISFAKITLDNIKNNDLIIALDLQDIEFLSNHKNLKPNCLIPIPNIDLINLCNDKLLFNKTIVQKGFGKFIPKIGQNLTYPYILKKSIAFGGSDCYIIKNAKEETLVKELLDDPNYFCQEIIKGNTEFATHLIIRNRKIAASLTIQYIFESNIQIKGKDKYVCRYISKCNYIDLFLKILNTIDFEGICCVNYKIKNNIPYILEINPRIGGSLNPYFFSFVRQIQ